MTTTTRPESSLTIDPYAGLEGLIPDGELARMRAQFQLQLDRIQARQATRAARPVRNPLEDELETRRSELARLEQRERCNQWDIEQTEARIYSLNARLLVMKELDLTASKAELARQIRNIEAALTLSPDSESAPA